MDSRHRRCGKGRWLRVLLSDEDFDRLNVVAQERGVSKSVAIRWLIQRAHDDRTALCGSQLRLPE